MDKKEFFLADLLSDNEIIARVIHGDKELYALLIRRHNQRLYRIGLSIINDENEVEDVMQSAYIKAYENLGKFAFKANFSTWLIKILINESLLRLKQRGRSINMNDDVMDMEIYQQRTAKVVTPLARTMNEELKTILEECIHKLPEKYKVVFIMREIEGMNVADTQECLDISEANVKVRLNRAKSLLKESLSGFYQKEDILHFHLSKCERLVQQVMSVI